MTSLVTSLPQNLSRLKFARNILICLCQELEYVAITIKLLESTLAGSLIENLVKII